MKIKLKKGLNIVSLCWLGVDTEVEDWDVKISLKAPSAVLKVEKVQEGAIIIGDNWKVETVNGSSW